MFGVSEQNSGAKALEGRDSWVGTQEQVSSRARANLVLRT